MNFIKTVAISGKNLAYKHTLKLTMLRILRGDTPATYKQNACDLFR